MADVVHHPGAEGARSAPAGAVSACGTFAWRALVKIKNVREQLGSAVVFPIVLTVVFTYLLGGAIAGTPERYLQFFIPGVLAMMLMSASMTTALTLNRDIATGMFDRVRSIAVWQPSVIVGAMAGDVVRYALTGVVPLLVGLVLGFRPGGGVPGVLLALLYLQLFTFSIAWLWMLLAVLIPDPTALHGLTNLLVFLLIFGSNILAPVVSMPSWLQAAINVNPVTHAVTATRGLMHGTVTAGQMSSALFACAVLILVFGVPAAILHARKQR
jgi:ABC-2 type transport system permease protein